MGKAIFYGDKKVTFVRCARKFGKTELAIYILYRWAGTTPNGQFYYIAPFYNQAAELIWHPGRLKNFLGVHKDKYIESINESDRRIIFKNGSFIKLLGSDNFEAGRGLNPDGAVYDEFKDHDYRFHQGFEDNLMAKDAPLVIVGTPPETFDHFFVRMEEAVKIDPKGAYFKKPTWDNPYIKREAIERSKQAAIAKGEWSKYMREIEAEIVPGGANSIFPMFEIPRYDEKGNFVGDSRHVKPHKSLIYEVSTRYKDYEFHWMSDPGSASCFASLFVAIHKETKRVIILDELYITDKRKTSTKQVAPLAFKKMGEISHIDLFHKGYDHAATWFNNEMIEEYGIGLIPCIKARGQQEKEDQLSVIKDFMLEDLYVVSDKCKNHISEMATYATDENGKIPKKNDHTIDCCFAKGTLITTIRGDKKIENISVEDKVLTRHGYRRVKKLWDIGQKETIRIDLSNGKHLVCTEDHKFFTLQGYTRAKTLSVGSVLWSLMELNTKSGASLSTIDLQTENQSSTYTEKYGNLLTGKFLKAIVFTIKTAILKTTTSTILSVLVWRATYMNTLRTEKLSEKKMYLQGIWIELEFLRQIGIGLLEDLSGTKSMAKKSFAIAKKLFLFAITALLGILRMSSLVKEKLMGFVQIAAKQNIEEKAELTTLTKLALFVVKYSELINTAKLKPVAVVAVHRENPNRVYDISVDGLPEYFANGVLAHNCRYIFQAANLNTLPKKRIKRDDDVRVYEKEFEYEEDLPIDVYEMEAEFYDNGDY